MHILAINSASSQNQQAIIVRIFTTLEARGVDCKGADDLGSNALHYAIKSGAEELVRLLLENGIDFNLINNDGHSPLSLALKGNSNLVLDPANISAIAF